MAQETPLQRVHRMRELTLQGGGELRIWTHGHLAIVCALVPTAAAGARM